MAQNGAKWRKTVQNGAKRRKTAQNGAKRCKMAQDGAREEGSESVPFRGRHKTAQDGAKRRKTEQDGARWRKMAQNGARCARRRKIGDILAGPNWGGGQIPRPLFETIFVKNRGAKAPFPPGKYFFCFLPGHSMYVALTYSSTLCRVNHLCCELWFVKLTTLLIVKWDGRNPP